MVYCTPLLPKQKKKKDTPQHQHMLLHFIFDFLLVYCESKCFEIQKVWVFFYLIMNGVTRVWRMQYLNFKNSKKKKKRNRIQKYKF